MDSKWKPFYRIIEQRSPVSFIIKNQLNGSTTKVHAQHLKPAFVETWDLPKSNDTRKLRKSTFVVPPESSDNEMDTDNDTNESSESEIPFQERLIRKYRRERDTSSDEDDIPLMELKKRVRSRDQNKHISESSEDSDEDYEIPLSKLKDKLGRNKKLSKTSDDTDISSEDEAMYVNYVDTKSIGRRNKIKEQQVLDIFSDMSQCLKTILNKT